MLPPVPMTPQMHVRCTSTHVSKTAEPSFGGGDALGHYSLNPMSNPARQQLSLRCEDNRVTKCDLVTSSSSLLPDRSCHLPAWIVFSIRVPQHWTFSVSIEVPGCQRLLMSRPLPQSAPPRKTAASLTPTRIGLSRSPRVCARRD